MRKLLLIPFLSLLAIHASLLSARGEIVDSIASLRAAIDRAKPGDTITLKNGSYDVDESIDITRSGAKDRPVTIAAETVGGVELRGRQGISIKEDASHIVISGFKFFNAAGKTKIGVGAHHIRITRCVFECPGGGPYLGVNGDDCEIDHNEFRNKSRKGNMISVAGENGQVARRAWIHHNYFHDFQKSPVSGETNGLETIRYGLSHLSMSTGGGVIEHNLFVRCVGENELISNKSCGNIYRHNTFLDSPGAQLTLRHGNDCVAEKNYFRNTAGLRIFGDRNKVIGNYLERNSNGINLGNGGGEVADGAKLTSHDRPDYNEIRQNILVENKSQYVMHRRSNGLGATHITFAENVIIGGDVAAKLDGPYTNPTWGQNTVWKTKSIGDLPKDAVKQSDPGALTPGDAGIRVLTPADVGPTAP
ncbi:polysaccharide lyase 6 family protein [Ereboglobus luteus]|uniref:Lyase n=1 Tax=Ereboglobus luteus TaxID=1796921 RepID=A0A2U8E5Q7_9BACT|nr:polysaccharide lyase 6 family protein [Ereboglobus luteus]AWI10268.1 hypothetical protein CKA38_14305 [Ereboglobus luteus]